jgi:hypothetical protein
MSSFRPQRSGEQESTHHQGLLLPFTGRRLFPCMDSRYRGDGGVVGSHSSQVSWGGGCIRWMSSDVHPSVLIVNSSRSRDRRATACRCQGALRQTPGSTTSKLPACSGRAEHQVRCRMEQSCTAWDRIGTKIARALHSGGYMVVRSHPSGLGDRASTSRPLRQSKRMEMVRPVDIAPMTARSPQPATEVPLAVERNARA